jgi:hypothetical protein
MHDAVIELQPKFKFIKKLAGNFWSGKPAAKEKYFIKACMYDQRRNEGLPTMHCVSLLFTITIFNERLAKSC